MSWNTRDLLIRCLRSLEAEVDAGRASVWVVDNGSTDGSAEAARTEAPWATVLEPKANLGFGRAVNEVARRTRGEWLAAANADVALEGGALQTLLAAGSDARVGCLAPRLILPDGTTQHSVHSFPTVPFALAFNLLPHRLSRRLSDRLLLEGFWDPERARPVPWAIGAFVMLRRAAFEAVGGFDERQWMYAEDLDLGWRLRDAGWLTRYEPAARVLHESGAAATLAFGGEQADRFMAETYAVLLRRRGRMRAGATAAANVLGPLGRLAWMAPLALVCAGWREPVREMQDWLAIHWRAVRSVVATQRER